jgi:hypothetical protein
VKTIKSITISILAVGLLAGSAVGVTAQNALVTGDTESIDDCGGDFATGAVCTERWDFDDARLSGESVSTLTTLMAEEGGKDLAAAGLIIQEGRLTNDGGAWAYTYYCNAFEPVEGWEPAGWPDEAELPAQYQGWIETGCEHFLLKGEDGYEGLVAYLTRGPRGYWGVIVEPASME